MKDKILRYTKEVLLFVFIMVIFANGISLYKSTTLNNNPFNLTNIQLIDNSIFTPSSEKPLLVHIWATWCPTCKVEASNIQTVSKHYDVLTIAVKSGSDAEIKAWLKENNYNFNVNNDKTGSLASNFNISVFPTTFVYDKDKNLVFSDVGYTSTIGLYLRMWWASL